jgi:hypothetical protein
MFKFINKLTIFKEHLIKITKVNDQKLSYLGRWCHVNMPNCNYDVVLKKIDMANGDNNFCIKPIQKKKQ